MSVWVPDALARSGKAVGGREPYTSSCPGRRPGIQKRGRPGVGWALGHGNDGWWAEAHPTKIVGRTYEIERLARLGEDKCQSAKDHPDEMARQFVRAFKVFNRGCQPVEEVSR